LVRPWPSVRKRRVFFRGGTRPWTSTAAKVSAINRGPNASRAQRTWASRKLNREGAANLKASQGLGEGLRSASRTPPSFIVATPCDSNGGFSLKYACTLAQKSIGPKGALRNKSAPYHMVV